MIFKKEFIEARIEALNNVGDTTKYKKEISEFESKKIELTEAINEIDNTYAKTGKDSNKRFKLNGDLVTINNKITELNEKVAAIEYKKIAIKNEMDILNGNAPDGRNRIPISSHAVIKYQPVKEFSLELWDLMLEKAIVYKDKIEFVWKE